MTDTRDLTESSLDWVRGWKWGKYEWEYLEGLPIPRMHARIYVFDRDISEWDRLTREAILFCGLPEPIDAIAVEPNEVEELAVEGRLDAVEHPRAETDAAPEIPTVVNAQQEGASAATPKNGDGLEPEPDISDWPIGKEVAEICGMSQSKVTRLITAGELIAHRDGKVRRVSPIDTISLWRKQQKEKEQSELNETANATVEHIAASVPPKPRWQCSRCKREYDDSEAQGDKCDCGGELGLISRLQKRDG